MTEQLVEAAHAEGGYQDIRVDGVTLLKGWRDCDARWDVIRPHLRGSTFLDVGSHYGYFGQRVTEEIPDALVLSMEADEGRATIQLEMLKANRNDRVLVGRRYLGTWGAWDLGRSCEMFDTVLALSVLHYIEETEYYAFALSQLAPRVIIEYPSPDELDVAERGRVQSTEILEVLEATFDTVTLVGQVPSPVNPEIPRSVWVCDNAVIRRRSFGSFLQEDGRVHDVTYHHGQWNIDDEYWGIDDGHWAIDGMPPVPGFNALSLHRLGVDVRPHLFQAAGEYHYLIQTRDGAVTDMHPRNVVVRANGLAIIDFEEGVGEPVYGVPWDFYRRKLLGLSEPEIFDWLMKQLKGSNDDE